MKVCCFVVKDNNLLEVDGNKAFKTAVTCVAATSAVTGLPVLAADPGSLAEAGTTVKQAAQPIIQAIVDLADPVAYACMIKGAMQLATGNEAKGKAAMKNAVTGYLVVKFTPQLFDFLDGLNIF